MVTVSLSPGEWIHLSWVGHRRMVWKGYRPRVRLVLAGGHASAWFSPFWRGPAPGAQRYQATRYNGIAMLHVMKCLQWSKRPLRKGRMTLCSNCYSEMDNSRKRAKKGHILQHWPMPQYLQNELLPLCGILFGLSKT